MILTRLLGVVLAAGLVSACAGHHRHGHAPHDDPHDRRHEHDAEAGPVNAVVDTLRRLHEAADQADGDAYFALFTDDAVFMGTDATERWTRPQFEIYARERFDTGTGWTYVARERHVFVADDGRTAWFDERLDNAKYGEARGTGVLVRCGDAWKIAHYNLTFPIPNALAGDVVRMIAEHRQDPGDGAPDGDSR